MEQRCRQFFLRVEYDGSEFSGYQTQRNECTRTVQDVLETAILKLTGEKVTAQGASRTDSGVHAKAQGVSFFTTYDCVNDFVKNINTRLPPDVVVRQIRTVADDFDLRINCRWKRYVYRLRHGDIRSALDRHHIWQISRSLSLDRMEQAAASLVGRALDFTSFTSSARRFKNEEKGPICCLESIEFISLDSSMLEIHITGDRFLYHMVRVIVGTLVEIGQEKRKAEDIVEILDGKNRMLAGQGAPANGLTLDHIEFQF